jgi:RecA-family ATPase
MSKWDDEPVPPRKWAIPDRVPANQAGLFSGEGGTGKSIIELTKDVAHVTGKDWLGSLPEPGPAFMSAPRMRPTKYGAGFILSPPTMASRSRS